MADGFDFSDWPGCFAYGRALPTAERAAVDAIPAPSAAAMCAYSNATHMHRDAEGAASAGGFRHVLRMELTNVRTGIEIAT